MKRVIELVIDLEHVEQSTEYYRVLGYLCQWGLSLENYQHLTIYSCRNGELNAAYRKEKNGPVTFFIAAIRDNDGKYSTHS